MIQDAPVYHHIFMTCPAGAPGAFPVHFPDFSGETAGHDAHLREVTFLEAVTPRTVTTTRGETGQVYDPIYVQVEHDLEYPYAGWDAERIVNEDHPVSEIARRHGIQPARYCRAAIVATPQMALIGD